MGKIKVVDLEETELTDRDKHIGRKPIGKVVVDVRDKHEVLVDALHTSLKVHRDAIKALKRDIKTRKLQIKKARLEYKIGKRG